MRGLRLSHPLHLTPSLLKVWRCGSFAPKALEQQVGPAEMIEVAEPLIGTAEIMHAAQIATRQANAPLLTVKLICSRQGPFKGQRAAVPTHVRDGTAAYRRFEEGETHTHPPMLIITPLECGRRLTDV